MCARFARGGVATDIPIQHRRRKITTENRIQSVSIIPLFLYFFEHPAFFFDHSAFFFSVARLLSHHHVGFAALPLCLRSGCACASGPSVGKLLLKFLYSKSAGQLLLEIAYNRLRSFRFFFPGHSAFFFRPFRFFFSRRAVYIFAPAGAARSGQYLRPLAQITTRAYTLRVGDCYFIATPGGSCRVISGAKIPTTRACAPALRSVMLRDWAFLFDHFALSLFFFLAVCGPVCLYRFP